MRMLGKNITRILCGISTAFFYFFFFYFCLLAKLLKHRE